MKTVDRLQRSRIAHWARPLGNQRGNMLLLAVVILALLTVVGLMATDITNIELLISGNQRQYKQELFQADGASSEVASYVDVGTWSVVNLDQLQILTPTGADINDPTGWPTNAQDANLVLPNNTVGIVVPYAYRVTYLRQGDNPKGYGSKFGTYVFDVHTQRNTVQIKSGYKKIGPKS